MRALVLSFLLACAATSDEPARAVAAQYPGGRTIAAAECSLGKVTARGMLMQTQRAGNPLEAVIAYREQNTWRVFQVPHRIEHSKGFARDFLAEYWTASGADPRFSIRCVNPHTDAHVNSKANGEFLFAAPPNVNHLCFSADTVYNSWTCFTLGPSGAPVQSFVQLNAD